MPRVEERIVLAAIEALSRPGRAVDEAAAPPAPGLYAILATTDVWISLGLGEPRDDRPLYVGKAEQSLASRDVATHFSDSKTGSSTLRRSLAALLREQLCLRACPRNLARPDGSANYGLEPDSDQRLTAWMRGHLRLSVWSYDVTCVLDHLESDVLERLLPPLNLNKISTRWTSEIKSRRAELAAESRAWGAQRC